MPAVTPHFLQFASAPLRECAIHLRSVTADDAPLLAAMYASTRAEELEQTPWSVEQKRVFTDWQSAMQEQHYGQHYPAAERLVIGHGGSCVDGDARIAPAGRIYVDTTATDVRLMEVTLLPQFRNRGIGTRVMNELLRYAEALQLRMSLHVEPFNPAKRMYERMGFAALEQRGLYEFMVRPARVPEL